ncbi:MAG: hypothetical protein HZC41_04640 [Chloroflexi bacterium]|nr:hypothetical protein [Chloroflexota bacterium]
MMKTRLRKLTLGCLGIAASFLFTLLLLEIAVRLLLPQQLVALRPDVYMPVAGVGFQHRPKVNTIVNTGERDVVFTTDANGHRVGSAPTPQPAYRILALGDSYLAALQVNYEQTMAARLEAGLSRALGQPVSVVNTGVSAYNPNQYLLVARQELAQADYDLALVFVYLANDVVDKRVDRFDPLEPVRRHVLRLPRGFSRSEITDAIFYPINDFLEERSHLYVFAKSRSSALLARLGMTAYYFPDVFLVSTEESPMWGVTADILADIAAAAAPYHVPVVYVLLPATYQINAAEFEWYKTAFNVDPATVDLDQPNRLLRTGLEARGLTVLDTTDPLHEAYRGGVVDLYGQVDHHFGAAGHQVVADYLLPHVLDYLQATPVVHQQR